jgi:uncharacterized protein YggE
MKALFMTIACAAMTIAIAQEKQQIPLITTTGNGLILADPDEATVRLGVTKQARTAAEAQAQANEVIQPLLSRIDALGIDRKNVQTSRLMLNPVYSSQPGAQTIVGYRATSTLSIRLTDFTLIGKVIDASIAVGGNTLEGVSFGLRDDMSARLEALKQAAQEAKAKAEALAAALGVRLGVLFEVVEGGASWAPMAMDFAKTEAMVQAETPVEPGQITVTASVTVRYVIISG